MAFERVFWRVVEKVKAVSREGPTLLLEHLRGEPRPDKVFWVFQRRLLDVAKVVYRRGRKVGLPPPL